LRGLPKKFGGHKTRFPHLRDQNQHQSSQNNANAVFCLASLGDKWSRREGLLEDYTMKDILSRHNLDWVPREVLAVVAGAYRLGQGFPDTGKIGLGCYNDPGDCFRGNAVFGSSGCLAIGSHRDGIMGFVHGFEPVKEMTLDDKRFQTVAAGLSFKFADPMT